MRARCSLFPQDMIAGLLAYSTRTSCQRCRRSVLPAVNLVRKAHNLRSLPYPAEQGLEPFLSPKALQTIAVDYQQGLLERLNEMVKDTEYENQSVAQTVISTAADRSNALIFNYASQALNNSFFLDNLRPSTATGDAHPQFEQGVRNSFGSMSEMKSTVSAAALGMIGSGWVWVVCDGREELAVVATYGSGTMLARSRRQVNPFGNVNVVGEAGKGGSGAQGGVRRSPHPPPTPSSASEGLHATSPTSTMEHSPGGMTPSTQSRSYHRTSPLSDETHRFTETYAKPDFQHIAAVLNPIFCISMHEHAWLTDYGVWGKEEYLKRFWEVLDWRKVGEHYIKWLQPTKQMR